MLTFDQIKDVLGTLINAYEMQHPGLTVGGRLELIQRDDEKIISVWNGTEFVDKT